MRFLSLALMLCLSLAAPVKAQNMITSDIVDNMLGELEGLLRTGNENAFDDWFDERAESSLEITFELEEDDYELAERKMRDLGQVQALFDRASFNKESAYIARDNRSAAGKILVREFTLEDDAIQASNGILCVYQIVLKRRDDIEFTKFECKEN